LVQAILNDSEGEFTARALTRNPESKKALELADLGAEVVRFNIDDSESIERSFQGAYGAFCVTFFWEHFSPEKEFSHASAMAQSAKNQGLKHVIWSTLEDTRRWIDLKDDRMPTLMGKYKVPHFDAKGEADNVFRGLGVPTTFLLTSFYWDNFIHFGMAPRKGTEDKLVLNLPLGDKKLPGIAVDDIGRCAYGIFKRGQELISKTVGIAGEHLTGLEMAEKFSEAFGLEVSFQHVPFDIYRSLDFPGAEDLGNMFQFKHDFQEVFCGARDLSLARELNPDLQTFSEWLKRHKERIPFEESKQDE
jgi:uncharacterized protein YbjT (DUF2867 family)